MLDKYDLIPTGRHDALPWRNESTQKPPKQALFVHETNADTVLKTPASTLPACGAAIFTTPSKCWPQ